MPQAEKPVTSIYFVNERAGLSINVAAPRFFYNGVVDGIFIIGYPNTLLKYN